MLGATVDVWPSCTWRVYLRASNRRALPFVRHTERPHMTGVEPSQEGKREEKRGVRRGARRRQRARPLHFTLGLTRARSSSLSSSSDSCRSYCARELVPMPAPLVPMSAQSRRNPLGSSHCARAEGRHEVCPRARRAARLPANDRENLRGQHWGARQGPADP